MRASSSFTDKAASPDERRRFGLRYAAQRPTDLSFNAGDAIVVERKKANGWWIGHLFSDPSKKGEFPSNYVQTG